MQSVIGALRVALGLDSAQFERGARRADRASQQLQKNLKRMATVATAAGAALGATTIAAGRTATEIRRLSQVANTAPDVLQRMAIGAKTVGIEQEKLSDILKDVNDRVGDFVTTGGGPMADFFEKIAPKIGITADAFRGLSGADALQLFVSSLEKANLSQAEMVFFMEAMASDSTLLLPLLRDNATEMNRLADSSASLGAIMDNETVASLDKMNMAVGEVSLAFQGMRNRIAGRLAPALEMLAVAFTNSMREGAVLRTVLDTIITNLDRVSVYVAVLITGFGVRYVAALAAARFATLTLTGSLVALRTALIRTGIGALVVGVGELIIQFSKLVRAAGGFGNAFALLKDVVVEVFDRIKMGAASAGARATAMFFDIKSDAATSMAGAIDSVVGFGNTAANTFEGALLAIKGIWSRLPDVIGDLVFSAANSMLNGIEAMLNGAIRRIDSFTGKIRDALASVGIETAFGEIGEISLADIDNPFAGASADAGSAAADAFRRAFEDNPFTAPDLGLNGVAADALATANTFRQAAIDLSNGATVPLTSLQALRDVFVDAGEEGEVALDDTAASLTRIAEAAQSGAAGAGDALQNLTDKAKERFASLKSSIESSMESGFMSIIDGTMRAKDAFKSMASEIIKELYRVLVVQRLVASISGFVGGMFGPGMTAAPAANPLSGLSGAQMLPQLANGTSYAQGGMTLVGERGPELVNMPRGSQVIDARRTASRMGNGDIVQNFSFNLSANGDESVRRIVSQAAPQIVEAAKAGVADAVRRGGSYGRAFA